MAVVWIVTDYSTQTDKCLLTLPSDSGEEDWSSGLNAAQKLEKKM